MTNWNDPQGELEIFKAKYEAARDNFRMGKFPMTEDVFRATLHSLGFRKQEITAEVEYAKESTT